MAILVNGPRGIKIISSITKTTAINTDVLLQKCFVGVVKKELTSKNLLIVSATRLYTFVLFHEID